MVLQVSAYFITKKYTFTIIPHKISSSWRKYNMNKYHIAFVRESGEWDIVDEFETFNDKDAMTFAEELSRNDYNNRKDWYVLDHNKNNINGG